MQNSRAYIFDLFGTLVLVRNEGYEVMMQRLIHEVPYGDLREYTLVSDFTDSHSALDLIAERFSLQIDEDRKENILQEINDWCLKCELFPEVKEVLAYLKNKDVKLAMLSNNHTFIESVHTNLDIAQYFDVITLSHKVGYAKPQKEIYELCLNQLDIVAQDAIMIGDQKEKDVDMPKSLGMEALLFDPEKKNTSYGSRIEKFNEL